MAGYQMTDSDRDKLRSNRTFLLKNINPSEHLLSCLLEDRVLNDDMKEEIEVEKLKKSKVARLLDILPKRGAAAFQHFIHALLETDHTHVARHLDESLVREWEKSRPVEEPRKHVSSPTKRQHSTKVIPSQRPCPSQPSHDDEESGMMFLNITPTNQEDCHMMNLLDDTVNNYRMSSNPRGRAVIINNTYFLHNTPRDGAAFDSQNLVCHLDQLYFSTVLYNDLTAQEIKDVFIEESNHSDHHDSNCFLAFVLSHGSQGYVYGIDGKKISIQDDIVKPMNGGNCPALLKKPKMFFIQACQGESATEGVQSTPTEDGDSQVDASPIPDYDPELQEALRNLSIQDNNETLPPLEEGPAHEMSDIVLAYSTVPGYRSWRRTDLGSWFVRAVIKVFSAEAHKEDLLSLLVKVRNMVSENQTNHEEHSFVQLTRTDETTKKKIYLFPGYYETRRGSRV